MAQVFEADGTAAKDYIFERKCLDGTVLNVRNAPSPACTASLAIAEQVRRAGRVWVGEQRWQRRLTATSPPCQVVDAAAEDFPLLAKLK